MTKYNSICYTAPNISIVKIVYSYSPMFFTMTYHKMFNLHLEEFNSRQKTCESIA